VGLASGGELKSFFSGKKFKIIFSALPLIALVFIFQNCSQRFNVVSDPLLSEFGSEAWRGPASLATSCGTVPAGKALIRKLNGQEIDNSLKDLLGLTASYAGSLPADSTDTNGFTNNAENLQLDADYMQAMMAIAEKATTDALKLTNSPFLQCPQGQNAACAKTQLLAFAKKAYRRPIKVEEESFILNPFSVAQTQGFSFQDSLGFAMQRILISPDFLYRSSFSGGVTPIGQRLSPHELATRLAFYLWQSTPDQELLAAADQNMLGTEEEIRLQVKRLLKDPKADRFIRNFSNEWLGLQQLQAATRDGLTDQLKIDMHEETQRLMLAVLREDRSFMDVISADFSYVNQNLATLYGIPGITGTQFQKVDFKALQIPRRGLLTQASLLTLTSSPTVTKPVARGNRILNSITCNPPPPFPDGLTVTPLADNPDTTLTIKERMAIHRQGTSCFACHQEMDPIGLGLENYDQVGRYRTVYASGRSVDASGVIRNYSFNNGLELIDFISKQSEFKTCVMKKMMTYAIGRSMTSQDQCSLQYIGNENITAGKTFTDLVMGVVMSPQFQANQTDSHGD
jgi:hypothetical protein